MEDNVTNSNAEKKVEMTQFVSGMSVKSSQAVENLRKICDEYFHGQSAIQIIDISDAPEKALEFQVIAIPTLIMTDAAGNKKTIIGDLSNTEKVLTIMGLK